MIEKILRLGKEAAIYGLSSIVGRFLNFLLVPFYTNVFLPSEYGVIANLYAYVAFAMVVYVYGMDAAYMRYVASLEIGDKRQNFSTPFISLLVSSFMLSLVVQISAGPITGWIGMDQRHEVLVQYAAWILFFDALCSIPYAALRMENKAGTFAAYRIFNIVVTIVLNIILILGFGMRTEGVLLANLIASGLTFVLVVRSVVASLTANLSLPLYKELLKFGIPYIPAGLASAAMQVINRPVLKSLTDDATVGIFQANYRLGIFMMLVVGMFDYAWRPFFLKHANDPDAKSLFSRVFTYFCVISMTILVTLSLFLEDLIHVKIGSVYFIHPDYWSGIVIVPVVLLAYAFNGAYVNFVVGVYLEKKTVYLPYVFGAGAAVNVAANLLLIPSLGMIGAAYATLFSYVVIAVGIYFSSQKFYRVVYEWRKIMTLAVITAAVYATFQILHLERGSLMAFVGKGGLLAAFTAALFLGRVIGLDELRQSKLVLKRAVD